MRSRLRSSARTTSSPCPSSAWRFRAAEARSENVADVERLLVANVTSSNWNWTQGLATLDIGNIHNFIPWQVVTISLDGRIIDSRRWRHT